MPPAKTLNSSPRKRPILWLGLLTLIATSACELSQETPEEPVETEDSSSLLCSTEDYADSCEDAGCAWSVEYDDEDVALSSGECISLDDAEDTEVDYAACGNAPCVKSSYWYRTGSGIWIRKCRFGVCCKWWQKLSC